MAQLEKQNPGDHNCEECKQSIVYGEYGSQIKSSNGKYYHRFCHPKYRPKIVTFKFNQHKLMLNLSNRTSIESCKACTDGIHMDASRYTYKHKKEEYSVHPDCAINLVPSDVNVGDIKVVILAVNKYLEKNPHKFDNMKVRLQSKSGGDGCEMCSVAGERWTYFITQNDGVERRYHLKCVRDRLKFPPNTQNFDEERGPNWQTELCEFVTSFLARAVLSNAVPFPINLIAVCGAQAIVAVVKIADAKAQG